MAKLQALFEPPNQLPPIHWNYSLFVFLSPVLCNGFSNPLSPFLCCWSTNMTFSLFAFWVYIYIVQKSQAPKIEFLQRMGFEDGIWVKWDLRRMDYSMHAQFELHCKKKIEDQKVGQTKLNSLVVEISL